MQNTYERLLEYYVYNELSKVEEGLGIHVEVVNVIDNKVNVTYTTTTLFGTAFKKAFAPYTTMELEEVINILISVIEERRKEK